MNTLLLFTLHSNDTENAHASHLDAIGKLEPETLKHGESQTVYQAIHARHAVACVHRFYRKRDKTGEMHLHIFFAPETEEAYEAFFNWMRSDRKVRTTHEQALWLMQVVATAMDNGCPLVWLVKSTNVGIPSKPDEVFQVIVRGERCEIAFSHGNVRAVQE